VPSRADELVALRRRVRGARPDRARDEERTIALAIRELKVRVSAALGEVRSCARCAGDRGPNDAFSGGDCCGGVTAELFSDEEVAALVLAGTRPRHLLQAPRGVHAGCAFRGVTGCTLTPEHRPQRCVNYICQILRRELHARGDLGALEDQLVELQQLMKRFVALRGARFEDELFATLEDALADAGALPRLERR